MFGLAGVGVPTPRFNTEAGHCRWRWTSCRSSTGESARAKARRKGSRDKEKGSLDYNNNSEGNLAQSMCKEAKFGEREEENEP